MKKLKIAILVADIDEYVNFQKKFEALGAKVYECVFKTAHTLETEDKIITSVCFGIGKVNAASAAMYFAKEAYDLLVNYGYSGGVSSIKRGDIMIADSFLEHDFDLTMLGFLPCEKPGQKYIYNTDSRVIEFCKKNFTDVLYGRAVCGDSFICDDKKRRFLSEKFSAMSCDMETAAIASVTELFKKPFLAVREISDDAGNDANRLYRDTLKNQTQSMLDIIFAVINAKEII